MQHLVRSETIGVTGNGGRGTAGAGPGRDLLYYCKIELLNLCVLRALSDSISPYPMESGNCRFACRSGMRSCVHICPLFFPSEGMFISHLYYCSYLD